MKISRHLPFLAFLQLVTIAFAQDMLKRVPQGVSQGFFAMRGKKNFNTEEMEHYYKRRPNFFVGVKGKNNDFDFDPQGIDYYKRAVPLGFIAMRGKKDLPGYSHQYLPSTEAGSLIGPIDDVANEKTASKFNWLSSFFLDFLGNQYSNLHKEMKQKNLESDYEITNEVAKRAAYMNQFFAMRGKKQNKRPFHLSSSEKFIGVRGKKNEDVEEDSQEVRAIFDGATNMEKKKGHQVHGFFAMRGKKWPDDPNDSESIDTSETPESN